MTMKSKRMIDMEVKSITEEGDVIFEGYANAAVVDDVGDLMAFDKVDMRRYDKNPILLYNHNRDLPIGLALEKKLSAQGLWIKGKISKSADPFVSYIRDLVKERILKTLSIGFESKKEERDGEGINNIKEWRLLEISVVTLPANIDAEFALAAKGLAEKNGVSYQDFMEGSFRKSLPEGDTQPKADPKPTDDENPSPPASGEGEPAQTEGKPAKAEGDKVPESVSECVAGKIPKLIEEGKTREQAIAIAVSMCSAEGKCGVENLSADELDTVLGVEKQVLPPTTLPVAQPIAQASSNLDEVGYGPTLDMAKAQVAMLGEVVNILQKISLQLALLAKTDDLSENENVTPPQPVEPVVEQTQVSEQAVQLSQQIRALAKSMGL